jgi:hypothetical protein
MHTTTISATQAARTFSKIINLVHYQGKEFNIIKGGEIVAHISQPHTPKSISAATMNQLIKKLPKLSKKDNAQFAKEIVQIRKNSLMQETKWG